MKDIPKSVIIMTMFLALCVMRAIGIDTFVTAGMSLLIGYITGKHMEQTRGKCK